MSLWRKLFSKEEQKFIPIQTHLQAIYQLIMPELHPHDYDYKESLFKTSIKFKTPSLYTEQEMKIKTRLQSVQLTRRTSKESFWRASYTEFLALYSSPPLAFAQNDLRKMIEQITDLEGSYTEYESLIKFEETVANIRQILMEAQYSKGYISQDILENAIHLLQQVIYAFEVELHEKKAADKRALLEKLKFEEDFMKKQ